MKALPTDPISINESVTYDKIQVHTYIHQVKFPCGNARSLKGIDVKDAYLP